jgi:2-hydroxychromene-2-carboxylate isomerase
MIAAQAQGRAAPIEFWFDFASGYAYFAALEIEALAERYGRTVMWRPFTLGAAFKVTGAQGLSRTPLKREYAWHDWQRLARMKGVPFNLPPDHPKVGLPAIRASITLSAKTRMLPPGWPSTSSSAISEKVSILMIPMPLRTWRPCSGSIPT